MLSILQVILHLGHVSPYRLSYLDRRLFCSILSPPFGPTLTRAAPTPLPGFSGSLYRGGDAHWMLVLMLSFAESAHFFFISFNNV